MRTRWLLGLVAMLALTGCHDSGSSSGTTSTGTGGSGGGSPGGTETAGTATLNVNVVDDRGVALDGAAVTTNTDAGASRVSRRNAFTARVAGNTDTDGRTRVEVDNGTTVIVRVSLDGHAEQTRRLDLPAGASTADLTVALRRLESAVVLADAEGGGSVSGVDGVALSINSDAFVDGDGNPVTGDVDVFMSPIDVTDERAVRAFPGEFAGVDDNGEQRPIASFGVADYRFFQDGEELELADGQTATIRIPLYATTDLDGTALSTGASLPLWSLDENTGIWQQEGFGTVVADAASPSGLAVEGGVAHFSPWNIDKVVETFRTGPPQDDDPPNSGAIRVRVACGASGRSCDPGLPPVGVELVTAAPGMAVARFPFLLPVDAAREFTLSSGIPLELVAAGADGTFGAEIEPSAAFTLAPGEVRDLEIVLRPLNELKRTFVPGKRLRGKMTNVGETHDYLFDVRAGETLSVAAFAVEDLFSPVGTSGQLGGRLSVLDEAGTVVASEVFDAFQVARIDLPVDADGTWSVRVEAEGKVPGFYVVTTGLRPLLVGRAYIKPNAVIADRNFGERVAIDGRTLAVAQDPGGPFNPNPVIVLERDPGLGWVQVAELDGTGRVGAFGTDVDIDGDTIVVGDPSDSTPRTFGSDDCNLGQGGNQPPDGAVYVFRRAGDGTWAFEACFKLPVATAVQNPDFGKRVAISGDTIAVSDPRDTVPEPGNLNSPVFSGAVHVFVRDDDTDEWNFQETIRSPMPLDRGELGGFGLDLDGDTLVVAENEGEDAAGRQHPGAFHVFERANASWSLARTFRPLDVTNSFSNSVAIDGNLFVVGAPGEERNSGLSQSGAVLVFERGSGGWAQTALLDPPQPGASDFFGWAVDVDGDDLVVGARFEDSGSASDAADNSASNAGAAYRARRSTDGTWRFTAFLKAIAIDRGDEFGVSVAIGADSIAVGTPNDDGLDGDPAADSATNSGAVYAFPR